jgi:centromeric protein E
MCDHIIQGAFEGYNGTIFCYGQTSSGKTHSIVGSSKDPGVMILAVHDVFDRIVQTDEVDYLVYISYLEIYNERLKDLLKPADAAGVRANLEVFDDKARGPSVKGLTEVVVCTPEHVLEMISMGMESRHISATEMNATSSRSHTIFKMVVESRALNPSLMKERSGMLLTKWQAAPKVAGVKASPVKNASLYMVDLAGSEKASRHKDTTTRTEGSNINKSLLTLSNVIQKLTSSARKGAGHIPYRDSKLTRLLSTSLGGNARTVLLCCVSPALSNVEETRSTLLFGKRAQRVQNNAVKNETHADELSKYRAEVADLRKQLQELESGQMESARKLAHQVSLSQSRPSHCTATHPSQRSWRTRRCRTTLTLTLLGSPGAVGQR